MLQDMKRRALRRSKIIQGQLKGLEKMIDQEQYCLDILIQSLAIQKSLSSLNKLVLENHLKTHILDMLQSDNPKEQSKAIEELLTLYELHNIRGRIK